MTITTSGDQLCFCLIDPEMELDDQAKNEKTVDELLENHFDKDRVEENDGDKSELKETGEDDDQDQERPDTDDESPDEDLSADQLAERKKQVLSLKESGNDSFRKGDYEDAIRLYREAGVLCRHKDLHTERAILYSNRAASELKLNLPKPAIHSASQAIKYNPHFAKGYLRRAKAYDLEEKLDEGLEDFKKVLELGDEKQKKEALEAIPDLERRINERNEKMKVEMMDKLKDLGNLVLRPFGLSTNNFQMAQDPKTGGYSINFKQN